MTTWLEEFKQKLAEIGVTVATGDDGVHRLFTADGRQLRAKWSPAVVNDLKILSGIDAEKELSELFIDQVRQEVVQ